MKYPTLQKRTSLAVAMAALFLGLGALVLPPHAAAQVYSGPGIVGGVDRAEEIAGVSERPIRVIVLDLMFTVLTYMGLAAVVVIVIAGIMLVVSMGDDAAKEKAKKIILYAVAGLIVIALAGAIVGIIALIATPGQARAQQEGLSIPAGSVFEMQAVSDDPAAGFEWSLVQGNAFLESARTEVFRTRLVQPGIYTLNGTVYTGDGEPLTSQQLNITVEQRLPGDAGSGETIPAVVRFTQHRDLRILVATPERTDVRILAIDLDTMRDTNGDGTPDNDDDTRGTLFRKEGNPLHLWFASGRTRTIRIGAVMETGEAEFFQQEVSWQPALPGTPQLPDTPEASPQAFGEIVILNNDNGTVRFMHSGSPEAASVLLHWDFGDGTQSLLDTPVHEYRQSGNYPVSVRIRDLESGDLLGEVRTQVVVTRLTEEPTPNGGDTEVPKEESGMGGMLWTIFKMLLLLIVSIAIGAAGIFVFSKVRKNFSLQKTLEKAEEKMVGPVRPTLESTPPPMEIPAEEPPEDTPGSVSVLPRETPPEPAKKDLSSEASAKKDLSSEASAKKELSSEASAKEDATASVPSWLQESPPSTEESAPASTPDWMNQTPAPSQTPPSPHTAMEPSAEQLSVEEDNAPSWLRAGVESAKATGQTPAAPPPPALRDEPASEPSAPPPPPPPPPPAPAQESASDIPDVPETPREEPPSTAPDGDAPKSTPPAEEPSAVEETPTPVLKPEAPVEPEAPAPEPEAPVKPEVPEAALEPEVPTPEPEVAAEPETPIADAVAPVEPEVPVAEPEAPAPKPEVAAQSEAPTPEPESSVKPDMPAPEPEVAAEPESRSSEPTVTEQSAPASDIPAVSTAITEQVTPAETDASTDDSAKEARLQEKKRLKRQRYRQNKKLREQESTPQEVTQITKPPAEDTPEESDDEPVAFIRVEDLGKETGETPDDNDESETDRQLKDAA